MHIKEGVDASKCRLHRQLCFDFVPPHNKCPILAKKYIKRHDRGFVQLHFIIWQLKGVKLDNEHRYNHVLKLQETRHENKFPVSWKQNLRTDRTVASNMPDIIMSDNEKGTCMLTDGEM